MGSESVHDGLQGHVFVEHGNTRMLKAKRCMKYLSQAHRFGESLEVGDGTSG